MVGPGVVAHGKVQSRGRMSGTPGRNHPDRMASRYGGDRLWPSFGSSRAPTVPRRPSPPPRPTLIERAVIHESRRRSLLAATGGPPSPSAAHSGRRTTWLVIAARARATLPFVPFIANCLGCPYGGRAIGPRGDSTAGIVLVGEAPGAKEMEEGRLFVGPAGRVLMEALAEAEVSDANVFITNAVACRPRPVHPWVRAIDACRSRLERDVARHPGAVVVALGATAARAVTGQHAFRVMDRHGTPIASALGLIVPTLHPARVLRRPSEGPILVADLRLAQGLARSLAH